MQTTHTPGNWYTANTSNGQGLVIAESTGANIAVTYAEQDARLIASAPDLLKIAQALTLATDEGDDRAQVTHYIDKQGVIRCKGSFLDLIEQARAAIARATGEQS